MSCHVLSSGKTRSTAAINTQISSLSSTPLRSTHTHTHNNGHKEDIKILLSYDSLAPFSDYISYHVPKAWREVARQFIPAEIQPFQFRQLTERRRYLTNQLVRIEVQLFKVG